MEKVYHEHQPETKFCNSCKQEKALSEYRAWKKGKFGVRPRCAQCERDYVKETYIYTEERNGHTKRPRPPKSDKEGFKYCSICLEEKELTLFHFRDGKPIARCIQCEQESDKARWNKRYQRRTQKLPEVSQPGHKVCNTCFREKPFEEFNNDTAQKDGIAGRCIQCKKEQYAQASLEEKQQRKQSRKASEDQRREQIREADRKRHNTDKHRAKRRENAARKRILTNDRLLNSPKPPPPPVLFKVCPKCDPPTEKPISEFALSKDRKDGHVGWCKECVRKYHSQENVKKRRREREAEQGDTFKKKRYAGQKRWREENLDTLRIQWREKYATDPVYATRMRKNSLKWIKAHPLEMQEHQQRRIARVKEATVEKVDLKRVLKLHGRWCHICEQDILPHQDLVFDHVIPLIPRPGEPQGTHSEQNLLPAHRECNGRKSNRRLEDLTPFDRRGVDPTPRAKEVSDGYTQSELPFD